MYWQSPRYRMQLLHLPCGHPLGASQNSTELNRSEPLRHRPARTQRPGCGAEPREAAHPAALDDASVLDQFTTAWAVGCAHDVAHHLAAIGLEPRADLVDPNEASYPWYRRTLPLAGISLVLVTVLNIIF